MKVLVIQLIHEQIDFGYRDLSVIGKGKNIFYITIHFGGTHGKTQRNIHGSDLSEPGSEVW